MVNFNTKYAQLLVDYCLEIKENERVFVSSTDLATPLLKPLYKEILDRGAAVDFDISFEGMESIRAKHLNEFAAQHVNPTYKEAMSAYDKYLYIRAPHNLRAPADLHESMASVRRQALNPFRSQYAERTANGSMMRSLCQYPTLSSAQLAGMSLDGYREFVFKACKLDETNPQKAWEALGEHQQHIVDYLNKSEKIHYLGEHIDIEFSCKGRIWINSDGKTNMPSGEVFTAPVDDSVNGHVYFSYPAIYKGKEVKGIRLEVKDGWITSWEAETGKDVLDQVFQIDGTRRFGEAAIGTNYQISAVTKNILFDEKIGGSIHLAIGQAYRQNNGTNTSSVHWDMITDMKTDSVIKADGKIIYENGKFVL